MSEPEPKNISDKLKQTIDELEIDRHMNDFVIEVSVGVNIGQDLVCFLYLALGDQESR